MLNKEFLERKVKLIQEDLARLEPLANLSFAELTADDVKYSAVERYLERIVPRALDINRHCIAELGKGSEAVRTHEDTFLRLGDLGVLPKALAKALAPSAGLRNILVHEYDSVDPRQVYTSVGQALSQYAQYCKALSTFLERSGSRSRGRRKR